ncbi:MAG: 4Fe-4S dicluster domain-containing protein [Acidimicrobiia bacterium]|nr:4Fe-4S dicluster domain-containing protein [Acidimicrobiia bacterium]
MAQAFVLDLGRCIGCEACALACKTGNELPTGVSYIELIEQVRGSFPDLEGGFDNHRCLHCQDAACVAVCPTGALYKEDGLTRLNTPACSGCEYCVTSCPYDVPRMVDGASTKCDGCKATTDAGGGPWCVSTCPSKALEYGERSEMLRTARTRAEALRAHYPNAQVYGETQAGGLGVILVLPDDPEVLGLPRDPDPPTVANVWQGVVQPVSIGLIGATAVAAGVAGVIARRNHMAELRDIEEAEQLVGDGDSSEEA